MGSDADILKLYAKTERLVLDGWQVTHVEGPAKQLKSGDLLDAVGLSTSQAKTILTLR